MNFNYLIKICELEMKCKEKERGNYTNIILKNLNRFIKEMKAFNPSFKTEDIIYYIKDLMHNYLVQTTGTKIYESAIAYYSSKKLYSDVFYTKNVYDKLYKMDRAGEIDIVNQPDLVFTTNIDANIENVFRSFIKEIRENKRELKNTPGFVEMYKHYKTGNSKDMQRNFEKIGRKVYPDVKDVKKRIKQSFQLFSKTEFELVEEKVKEYVELEGKNLKPNLIKIIKESVDFLNEFGMLEYYIELNNKSYKKIYINDIDYKYEEVKNLLLNEEELRKQNAEGLILMAAFWTNRVNKVMKDICKSVYSIENSELQEEKNGKMYMDKETDANLELKMLFLHKLYFNLFQKAQREVIGTKEISLNEEIDIESKRMGKEYEQYFSKLFPNSKNSLKEDLHLTGMFENIRYNSYQIKDSSIESVIICLANSELNGIENFGYINENNRRKEALIGVDLKGYNMYIALHCNKKYLKECWKETTGSAEFPIYKGAKDFIISDNNDILKPQIFVPLTQDATEKIENALQTITKRDRYGNSIKHIAYLTKNGKMPEHMMKKVSDSKGEKYEFVKEFINLDTNEDFNLGLKTSEENER